MPGNIGKLRIWKPIDVTNRDQVKAHPHIAGLQKLRQRWLEIRNRFGISVFSAQVKALKTVEVATFESRMRNCLSLISADLDHMKEEPLNNVGYTRPTFDNRRAALEALDKLAKGEMPPGRFGEHLNKQLEGLRANQLQQLRKNAAVLLGDDTVTLGGGAGDPTIVQNRKGILDHLHETCNQRLVEKGYGSLPSPIEVKENRQGLV
jgi:hypothetical protein